MAIRSIRKEGDEVLRKKSREVDVINEKIITLLEDMKDTLKKADNGVGLAAPQIGILKRLVVIDTGEQIFELINPVIMEQSGEQVGIEGCLSIPGIFGEVKRPEKVTVQALNPNGDTMMINAEGFLSVILCHEIDHLEGILYKDKAIRMLDKDELEEEA